MEIGKSWWKSVIWGIYHFFMIILLITNTIFLIFHWADFRLELSETSLILTFVGFLFAFAGINIYSIFNTNIEEEKKRLNDVYNQYKDEISETLSLLIYSKKLINYYQLSQMIVTSKKFTSQSLERIISIANIVEEYKSFLKRLYERGDIKRYEEFKKDFIDVSRGIKDSLNYFYNDGSFPQGYFSPLYVNLRSVYKERLFQLIEIMNTLETYDYTGTIIVTENKNANFKQRWKNFVKSFCALFKISSVPKISNQ